MAKPRRNSSPTCKAEVGVSLRFMMKLVALQETMFSIFGEDLVRKIADQEDIIVDVIPDMLDDETALDLFAEMVNFIIEFLAPIDSRKAKRVLLSADISESTINELLE